MGVRFENVAKVYPGGTRAVSGVNLEVGDGEFVVFVGPSGCGKSTLLRMIAGLEEVSSGTIHLDGSPINHVAPRDRDIAMVFQSYALYPQLTVRQNIGFSLRQHKVPKAEIAARVDEIARALDLVELLDRKPKQLSGGQRQRVAMGRAIIRRPKAFLLDEPLSNLDAKLRVQMRAELGRLHARFGITTILVTHDQVEAMTLGDRIAVFSRGELQQYGTPHELYHEPRNMFVGGFIGSPAMNFLAAVHVGGGHLQIGHERVPADRLPALPDGMELVVGIRPEDLSWLPAGADDGGIGGRVELVERVEPESYVVMSLDDPSVVRQAEDCSGLETDDELTDDGRVITMRVRPDGAPAVGDRVRLSLASSKLHYFSASDGSSLIDRRAHAHVGTN